MNVARVASAMPKGIDVLRSGRFRVRFQMHGLSFARILDTLEEAVQARETMLAQAKSGTLLHKRQRPRSVAPIGGAAVYFLEAVGSGRIKIGWSDGKILGRMRFLGQSAPFPLRLLGEIPGDRGLEQQLHGRFAEIRLHGEWFLDCDELREFIDAERVRK